MVNDMRDSFAMAGRQRAYVLTSSIYNMCMCMYVYMCMYIYIHVYVCMYAFSALFMNGDSLRIYVCTLW